MKPSDAVRRALEALTARQAQIEADLATLPAAAESEARSLNDDETARLDALLAEHRSVKADVAAHQARLAELDEIEQRATAAAGRPGLQFIRPAEKAGVEDVRSMNLTQLVDAVRRGAEERGIDPSHAATLMRRHGGDMAWARNLAARSTDAYASGFQKLFTGNVWALTDEERAAVAVGTNTQGGLLVPTHLDPSIIISNTGTTNVVRQLSRVVTLTDGKQWNGVTSAGVTASFDAELAEVSDDSPSFTAAGVPLYTARALVQASVEAYEDIAGLPSEVLGMFADAKDRLEAAAHCTGTGSGQPFGIFVAITNSGSQAIVSTTAATIGLVDLLAVKTSLGPRFRRNASWVLNPTWMDSIRQLGTSLSASFSVYANEMSPDRLLGYTVYETDDAPATATTTTKDPEIIFGDFSNYVIVDKPGSFSVQYLPPGTLTNTANNLPDGRVGWFAWWRTGADSVNDAAFRVLVDKTSA
ncbi:MAG: hypothetical protein RLZ14_601 [Actinomycetota bacterium]